MKILIILLRVLLTVVFVVAAMGKLLSPADGPPTLYDQWLARGSIGHYAFIGFELLLGLWLLLGWRPRASALVALVVLGVFSGLIWHESRQYAPHPCGCLGGGTTAEIIPDVEQVRSALKVDLLRNIALMVVAGWLLLVSGESKNAQPIAKTTAGTDLATGSDEPDDAPGREA
ncbi:MAG: DoxX family membrane protein [Phycisphaerales bacterium]|nr:DoxX family membrane protein [Phycisphaerales bacterium]